MDIIDLNSQRDAILVFDVDGKKASLTVDELIDMYKQQSRGVPASSSLKLPQLENSQYPVKSLIVGKKSVASIGKLVASIRSKNFKIKTLTENEELRILGYLEKWDGKLSERHRSKVALYLTEMLSWKVSGRFTREVSEFIDNNPELIKFEDV